MNEFNETSKQRLTRQRDDAENEIENVDFGVEATTFSFDSSERQEDEEGGNAVVGLVSTFLGQLSNVSNISD